MYFGFGLLPHWRRNWWLFFHRHRYGYRYFTLQTHFGFCSGLRLTYFTFELRFKKFSLLNTHKYLWVAPTKGPDPFLAMDLGLYLFIFQLSKESDVTSLPGCLRFAIVNLQIAFLFFIKTPSWWNQQICTLLHIICFHFNCLRARKLENCINKPFC